MLALLLSACTARPSLRADPDVLARGRALAMTAVQAHGGLDRWRTLGGVALHLRANGPYYPREADYLFDPARNRAWARFVDKHGAAVEWRYDAKRGTIVENGRCVGSAKKRAMVGGLLSNLLFFFGVPFKFVDEGARQRAVDANRYFVTYENVGDTPRDWYLVTLAPDRRVHDAIYVASGFTTLMEFRNVWEEWIDVGGFLVGTRRRVEPKNAFWRALAPRIAYQMSDVRIGQPLDDAAFAPPAGCS
ncbi:MAG: hypothetical protein JWM53_4731 [bacterium]|nr:hypothetical protein [bacterium]